MNRPGREKRTVVVVHPGALGDVLLARQALRALREAFPGHAVGLIAQDQIGTLLRDCREADRCFPLEGSALACLLACAETAPPDLKEWLEACDLAVCWMDDPGGLAAALKAWGIGRIVMKSASGPTDGLHQSDYLLRTLGGTDPAGTGPGRLELPHAIREEGRAALGARGIPERRFVVIHPGSGSPHKCVAPGILAAVSDELILRGAPVVLAAGPADEDRVREALAVCARKPHVIGGQALAPMAGILAHAAMFIGHDSGLTHLAAALGIPTLALFGPTDAGRWAPRGPSVAVLSGSPCRCDGWEAVRSCEDKPCLGITPARILSACDEHLSEAATAEGLFGRS